jgi:phage terminase small subunit
MSDMKSTLSERQLAFCIEYIKDSNGMQAAIRAGYSKKTARTQACDILTRPHIKAKIKELRDSCQSAAIMEHDEACRILTSIARGTVGAYTDADGNIDMAAVKEHCPEAVQSIDQRIDMEGKKAVRVTKLRLASPVQAIERLAKLKGWDKQADQGGNIIMPTFVFPGGKPLP